MQGNKEKDKQITHEFLLRQGRQFLAIALTLLILLALSLLYRRHDFFGQVPKNLVVGAQIMVVAAFIVFSAFNWRCPSCRRYLGADIGRQRCKRCGARLR